MKPQSKADRQGWLIIAILAACVLVIVATLGILKLTKLIFDKNNCQLESSKSSRLVPVAQTVILVDQSEPLTPTQREFSERESTQLIEGLKEGERILLYTFSEDESYALRPKIALCKPQNTANPLTENQRKILQKFQNEFLIPLKKALEETLSESKGHRSPILEAIRSVTRSRAIEQWEKPKHLVLISDLLQHNPPTFTQYVQPAVKYSEFVKTEYGQSIAADLRGWEITVIYLQRKKDRVYQTKAHLDFWLEHFYTSGAKMRKMESVD